MDANLYSYQTNWSQTLADALGIRSAVLANFLLFGLPFWLIFNYGFFNFSAFSAENAILLSTVYIAGFWIVLGPIAIMLWEKALAIWAQKLVRLANESGIAEAKIYEILRHRKTYNAVFCSFYALAAIVCFNLAIPFLRPIISIPEYSPLYWLTTLVLAQIGFATGIGAAGVVWSSMAYSQLAKLNLAWQPFHEDRRGGYLFLVQFLLITAGLFSVGSIIVPAAISIGAQSDPMTNGVIIGLIALYSVLIMLSFAVPSGSIAQMVSHGRQNYLRPLNQEINRIASIAVYGDPATREEPKTNLDLLQKAALLATFHEHVLNRSTALLSLPGVIRVLFTASLPVIAAVGQLVLDFYLQPWISKVLQ